MLQCVAVCFTVLHCVVVSFCICIPPSTLYAEDLYGAFVHCVVSVLQCVAVCCSVLQCVVARCSALQCVAVCVAMCCSVLQHHSIWIHRPRLCAREIHMESSSTALQCVVGCCGVLQCVAVCCSVLQCVAVCCGVIVHR